MKSTSEPAGRMHRSLGTRSAPQIAAANGGRCLYVFGRSARPFIFGGPTMGVIHLRPEHDRKPGPYPKGRVCVTRTCITRLNTLNPGPRCNTCEDRWRAYCVAEGIDPDRPEAA